MRKVALVLVLAAAGLAAGCGGGGGSEDEEGGGEATHAACDGSALSETSTMICISPSNRMAWSLDSKPVCRPLIRPARL